MVEVPAQVIGRGARRSRRLGARRRRAVQNRHERDRAKQPKLRGADSHGYLLCALWQATARPAIFGQRAARPSLAMCLHTCIPVMAQPRPLPDAPTPRTTARRGRLLRLRAPGRRTRIAALIVIALIALIVLASFFVDEPLRRTIEAQMNERLKGYTAHIER